jgi:diguanylate cyclase (GGDEF)-like protein
MVFTLVSLVLLLAFIIRIFAPGTNETAFVFQKLQVVQPVLNAIVGFLVTPITVVWGLLVGKWPKLQTVWFPIASAEQIAYTVVIWILKVPHMAESPPGRVLRNANLSTLFPGVIDWRLLLALPLWGKVEAILLRGIIHAEAFQYRQYLRRRDAAMLQSFQEPHVQKAPSSAREDGKDLFFREMMKGLQSEISNFQGTVHLDPLTRLFNRAYFNQRLTQEMMNAKDARKTLALLMIDIDDFKTINERYGQAIGNMVLAQVAQIVSDLLPSQGKAIAGRYGGEEIAILLTDTSIPVAEQMAEAICQSVSQIHLAEAPKVIITVSVGVYTVCFVPTNGSHELTEASFVAKADSQMYIAKRNGKNRVVSASLP